ncbi:MAG: HlyD family secretion protein [Chroococcidiopsis sp.]
MSYTPNSHILSNQNAGEQGYINNGKTPPAQPTVATESDRDWSYDTQELLDTLPRVWTRGLLYLLVFFAGIILPWSMLAKVDETGSARGRLEPKGKTVRLDAPVTGAVAEIEVKEGQFVKAGQTLLALESEEMLAQLQQARAKLEGQLDRLPQVELIKNQLKMTALTQRQQSKAQAAGQQAQIHQNQQQIDFHKTEIDSAKQLLAKDRSTVQRFRQLRQSGVISGLQLDEAERTMIDNQQRLIKAKSDIQQAQNELKKQQSTYESTLREGELAVMESERSIKEVQAQITDLQAEIAQSRQQIESLLFQLQQRVLRAPIDGTIFQLPIQRAGAVVQPGDTIAQIAPKGTSLVVRAQMASPESGFLRLGLPVKIKFDAYPFQDYGVVEGRVSWISPDSKTQETNQGRIESFELEITPQQPYIQTANKRIAIKPGQTATAEVVIRQRRVIDFILDPFKKLQAGGLEL